MAVGLPEKTTELHEIVGRSNRAERVLGKLYYIYLRIITCFIELKLNRGQKAPVKALKLIYANPNNIRTTNQYKPYENHIFPEIKDGEWDKDSVRLDKGSEASRSIKQRFEQNHSWNETEFYNEQKNRFQKGETQYAKNTEDSFDDKLDRIEGLYENIKNNGYRTQDELEQKTTVNDKIDHHLQEFNEVTVNIGRDGKMLLVNGLHRVTISQILDIEKIPVRILVRHKKWQEKRNKAVEKSEALDEELRSHPDIEYLLD